MNIKPLADRVLIEPTAAEKKTLSGIIIPDTAKEKPLRGKVLAVGQGTKDDPMILKAGDEVLHHASERRARSHRLIELQQADYSDNSDNSDYNLAKPWQKK